MHVTDRSKTVVMLIDWDNLQICHSRDAPGTDLDLQALIALAQSYGTLVSARAYAEWNLLSERLAVYKAGIEPVFAPVMRPEGSPREGKSLADTVMVADGVDLLWTVAPDVFVLATSDKDMIPLARIAKQRGAAVVVLGSDLTAIPLVEMSNVFITYRQLLRELDRVSELEAPVGRAPARERRLRESRRPSGEPYGGLGSGALGAGPIGTGGRTSSRAAGIASAPTPLPPSRAPRRRLEEPAATVAPAEVERALPAPAAPAPLGSEAASEEAGVGSSEVAPRRRRRRGGRGRRTGLGGAGEADLQAETLQDTLDDSDAGDGTEDGQSQVASSAASPDDIDDAVLRLLAARDTGTAAPAVGDERPADADEAPAVGTSAADLAASQEPSPPVRRVARTSFSSFGPPDVPVQRTSSASPARDEGTLPAPEGDVGSADQSEGAPAATAGPSDAGEHESVTQGLAPDAVVSEAVPVEPVADEVFPQLAPISAEEAVLTPAPAESPSATADDTSRPARSSRSGRTGAPRRTRRPAAESTAASEPAAGEAASDAGEQPTRAPRRRRARRPAASAATSEPVTSETGS
jgi:hypothetical protein